MQPFYIRKEPEVEPDTPWRKVSFKDLTIPKEAYKQANNVTLTQQYIPVKVLSYVNEFITS